MFCSDAWWMMWDAVGWGMGCWIVLTLWFVGRERGTEDCSTRYVWTATVLFRFIANSLQQENVRSNIVRHAIE